MQKLQREDHYRCAKCGTVFVWTLGVTLYSTWPPSRLMQRLADRRIGTAIMREQTSRIRAISGEAGSNADAATFSRDIRKKWQLCRFRQPISPRCSSAYNKQSSSGRDSQDRKNSKIVTGQISFNFCKVDSNSVVAATRAAELIII